MTLDVERSGNRTPNSFTLKPETVQLLDELATALDTNRSRVIEAMITKFGPALLADAREGK